MGNLQAISLAELAIDDNALHNALAIHLGSNHYPPISYAFIPVAKQAIELASEGEWDAELEYPNGLVRTVSHTVEGLHLDAFVQAQGGEDYYE